MTGPPVRIEFQVVNATPASRAAAAVRGELLQLGGAVQRMQSSTSSAFGTFSRFTGGLSETGQAAARAAQGFTGLGAAATQGSRGLGAIRNAMAAMAFQAAGVPGILGRISSGALLFAGGSTLVLGVTAGLAAIAGAWRLVTRDAREAAAAQEAAGATLVKLNEQKAPAAAALNVAVSELDAAQTKLDKLRAIARQETEKAPAAVALPGEGLITERTRQALVDQQNAVNRLRLIVDQQRRGFREQHAEFEDLDFLLPAEQRFRARLVAQSRGLGPVPRQLAVPEPTVGLRGVGPRVLGLAEAPGAEERLRETAQLLTRLETPQERFNRQLELLRETLGEGTPEFAQAAARLREELAKTTNALPQLGVAIVSVVGGAIQALSTGNVGGFLSAIGGVVGAGVKGLFTANPLLGAGLSVLGTAIGLGSSRGVRVDEYGARAMDQMRQASSRPEQFTLVLVADTGEEIDRIQYELGRAQRRDQIVRLPRRFGHVG